MRGNSRFQLNVTCVKQNRLNLQEDEKMKRCKQLSLLLTVFVVISACIFPVQAKAAVWDGETICRDLNGDGIQETIRLDCYSSYYAITVNNERLTFDYAMNDGDSVYFEMIDLNKKDNYVEIVVTDDMSIGSAPEICNYVLRYTGTSLIKATVQAKNPYASDCIYSKRELCIRDRFLMGKYQAYMIWRW